MPPLERLPEPFSFYVDECLGGVVVPDAIRRECLAGESVLPTRRAEIDAAWLIEAGARGWICFSRDRELLKRPIERDAIVYSRVALFLVKGPNGEENARLIANVLPMVRKVARELERAFVARIEPNKIVVLLKGGKRLDPPESVKANKKACLKAGF